jgi:glycosyltransferase involved in cell wall biosynthesis
MRICYLINGLNGGGAALPLPEVLSLMRRAGHQVSLVALARQDGRSEARLREAGIDFRVLGPERIGLRSFLRLLRLLRAERPDVLWTSLTGASFLGQLCGWRLGIPVVSWQHNAFLRRGNRLLLRLTRSIPALWVADSEAVRGFAIDRLGIDAGRLHVWPLFVAEPRPPAAAWPGFGPFRIGSLGRLHHNKGYDVLVRALALLQSREPALSERLQVCIAGSGPEQRRLQDLADELGVRNLRFEGFVAEPAEFLRSLHAYVQPSRNEGLCLAAHEAMQAALAVIATPVGQLAHSIVDGGSGWLCAAGDAAALAAAITRAIACPADTAAMGLNARDRVLQLFGRERFQASGNALLRLLEQRIAPER